MNKKVKNNSRNTFRITDRYKENHEFLNKKITTTNTKWNIYTRKQLTSSRCIFMSPCIQVCESHSMHIGSQYLSGYRAPAMICQRPWSSGITWVFSCHNTKLSPIYKIFIYFWEAALVNYSKYEIRELGLLEKN